MQLVSPSLWLPFPGFVSAGNVMNRYATILLLLLRLRQACDHPFLVLGRATGGEGAAEDAAAVPVLAPGGSSYNEAFLKDVYRRLEAAVGHGAAEALAVGGSGGGGSGGGGSGGGGSGGSGGGNAGGKKDGGVVASAANGSGAGGRDSAVGLPPHVQAVLDELQRNGSDNLECPVCIDTPVRALLAQSRLPFSLLVPDCSLPIHVLTALLFA